MKRVRPFDEDSKKRFRAPPSFSGLLQYESRIDGARVTVLVQVFPIFLFFSVIWGYMGYIRCDGGGLSRTCPFILPFQTLIDALLPSIEHDFSLHAFYVLAEKNGIKRVENVESSIHTYNGVPIF